MIRAAARDWPRTTRIMPWAVAGFILMLFLTPFDAIDLPLQLPIDAKLDRFALGVLAVLWLVTLASDRGPSRPRFTASSMDVAIGIFLLVVIASLVLNAERIALADELGVAIKKLALLLAYLMFFYVVATSVRPSELRAFGILIVALGTIVALGVIWEYRLDANLFFDWTEKILPPGLSLESETSDPAFGRRNITGPAIHALAVTSMLAMALPFALIGMLDTPERRARAVYAICTVLIFAGTMSTMRKSAVFAPAAALIVLLVYRPRQMLKLLPFGIVLIFAIQAVSPGALGSLRSQLDPERVQAVATTQDRIADYDAIRPDQWAYFAVGRGYGTYDHNKYRLLDNQYLGIRMGTGVLGFAAYLGLVVAALGVAHLGIRSRDRLRAPVALAAGAAAAVFGMVSLLFDVMAFPQVPYIFLLCAGLAVAASRSEPEPAARRPLPLTTGFRGSALA